MKLYLGTRNQDFEQVKSTKHSNTRTKESDFGCFFQNNIEEVTKKRDFTRQLEVSKIWTRREC